MIFLRGKWRFAILSILFVVLLLLCVVRVFLIPIDLIDVDLAFLCATAEDYLPSRYVPFKVHF